MWFFLVKSQLPCYTWTGNKCLVPKRPLWVNGSMERWNPWYNWAAERYDPKILTAEEKTMQKFPALKRN